MKINHDSGHKIAITGGIGSGKSFVLELFANADFPTFNYDQQIHKLLHIKSPIYNKIVNAFPTAVKGGQISRALLAEEVFENSERLKLLENLLHPAARELEKDFIKENASKTVVVEVPLLFEKHRENEFDIVIVTHADEAIRKNRALERKGMNASKLDSIIAKQVDDEYRKLKADIIIDTSYDKGNTIEQFNRIICQG